MNLPAAAGAIRVVALAVVSDDRLLVVRKRSGGAWILPGGKPEAGESETEALRREISEELSCHPVGLEPLGRFIDEAAHQPGVRVQINVYTGRLKGSPKPTNEIEQFRWAPLMETDDLAPVHAQINPVLTLQVDRAAGGSRPSSCESPPGSV
jgi:8-oxo-dGTP pyrophosphatase MutT (NUDIX family)